MVTERTIINSLIVGGSLVLAPFIISESLSVDYLPALVFAGLAMVIFAFFFVKEKLCVCPILGGAFAGSLNFLPIPLQASQIAAILLILYYVTGYVIIRQRRIRVGRPIFLWPILIITLIIFYHNHDLKVGALGGDTEGGKPAILIYIVFVAYFCGINVPTPSVRFLSRIPFYFLLVTLFSSIPYIITTLFPPLAPYLFYVTDSVNVEAYVETMATAGVGQEQLSKLAAFGPIAAALQLYLLSRYPIGSWLRPERWWIIGLSLFCVVLTCCSGYRNNMFSFGMITMVGAWAYYSWRAVMLPAVVMVVALVVLIASSNNIIDLPVRKLPVITQRTLSFLPGDWDPEAIESGKSSNEFRQNIEDVYLKEYVRKSPLFGNGFSIDTKTFQYYEDSLKTGATDQIYAQSKLFIEGKMFHTGWMSVYDVVGIVGMTAFIVLGWNEIWTVGRFVWGPRTNRRSSLFPVYVWMLCNLVSMMVSFFVVFGDFKATFMGLLSYGILLSHLLDLENAAPPVALSERPGQSDVGRLTNAHYGYRSKT
jgi:hypothetical protein